MTSLHGAGPSMAQAEEKRQQSNPGSHDMILHVGVGWSYGKSKLLASFTVPHTLKGAFPAVAPDFFSGVIPNVSIGRSTGNRNI